MWEYTGTGWITYLGHDKPIKDEQKQYEAVRAEDLRSNGLEWLPPAPKVPPACTAINIRCK